MNIRLYSQASAACTLLLAGSASFALPGSHAPGRSPINEFAVSVIPFGVPSGPGTGLGSKHFADIIGTITTINTTDSTITVTPSDGGTASVISLTSSTVFTGHETISGSAIALGDTLEVSGIPLALQVSSIGDDHIHTSTSSSAASTISPTSTTATGTASVDSEKVPGSIRVRGIVTSLQPATIEVGGSFSLALSVSSSTKISELTAITASDLTVGDTVTAQVTPGSGTLTAVRLDVTAASS